MRDDDDDGMVNWSWETCHHTDCLHWGLSPRLDWTLLLRHHQSRQHPLITTENIFKLTSNINYLSLIFTCLDTLDSFLRVFFTLRDILLCKLFYTREERRRREKNNREDNNMLTSAAGPLMRWYCIKHIIFYSFVQLSITTYTQLSHSSDQTKMSWIRLDTLVRERDKKYVNVGQDIVNSPVSAASSPSIKYKVYLLCHVSC